MIHSEIGSDFPLKQQIIRLPSLLLKRWARFWLLYFFVKFEVAKPVCCRRWSGI